MILPTKGVSPDLALLTVGGEVLNALDQPATVSSLWYSVIKARGADNPIAFDWFILALDLLFALGAINHGQSGIVTRQAAP